MKCKDCDDDATPNRNGKIGLRCDKHKGASNVNQNDDDASPSERRYWALVLAHAKRVEAFLKQNESNDPSYKGMSLGEIRRALDADVVLTADALSHIGVVTRNTVPERYRLTAPVVQVPKSLWPKNFVPPDPGRPWDNREYLFNTNFAK